MRDAQVLPLLAEPAFFGRDRELTRLESKLAEAVRGHGSLVLLEGQSGRGKSRLVRELLRRAPENALILEGQGTTQGVQRPLQLLVNPVRQLREQAKADPQLSDRIRKETETWAGTICSVLSELEELYGIQGDAAGEADDRGKERTLRAMLALVNALGTAERPAILVLDDCQWADDFALALLAAWLRTRARQASLHLMILVAFRSEEVSPGHPLRQLACDEHVALPEFDERAVREILRSMAGGMPEEVVDFAARLAGGSPFMACTILHGLVDMGVLARNGDYWLFDRGAVSADMGENSEGALFLKRRIDLLDPSTVQALKIGAILGKEFDHKLAAQLAGCDARPFEEAERRHILRAAAGAGRVVFVHDKLRETLLNMLTADERRLACLHVAALLEQESAVKSFDLAYYYEAAGEYQRALPYALKAAEEARARASLQIAEQQYRIALKGAADQAGEHSYRISRGLGEVLMLRGEYQEALTHFERALHFAHNELESVAIEVRVCETHFKMGDACRAGKALSAALAMLGRPMPSTLLGLVGGLIVPFLRQVCHTLFPQWLVGRRTLRDAEREILVGRLLNLMGYVHWFEDAGLFNVFWAHFRGFNLLEQYEPTEELVHVYSSHAMGMGMIGLHLRGLPYARRAIDIARKLGTAWGEGQALSFYGCSLLTASRFPECVEYCLEAAQVLEQTGDLWELNIANCNAAYGLYRVGNLAEAANLARRTYYEAMDSHDLISAASCLSCWSKATSGDIPLEEAERLRGMLSPTSLQPAVEVGQAEAIAYARLGDLDRAIDILEQQCRRLRFNGKQSEYVAPALPWLATMLRRKAEGLPAAVRERRRLLRRAGLMARLAWALTIPHKSNLPHVMREMALLALAAGRPARAKRCAEASVRAAEGLGMRHDLAQGAAILAGLEAASGTEEACRVMEEAASLLREIGGGDMSFALETGNARRLYNIVIYPGIEEVRCG